MMILWDKMSSKEYEAHVKRVLQRNYPKGQWLVEEQSPVSGGKVDFMLKKRGTSIKVVVDAKTGAVTANCLRQLDDYKRCTKAKEAIIYTLTPLSKLSNSIKQRAKELGIKILYSAPKESF
ncbi:restriction endonuclease [Chloroflexota bacterium]